jgi:Fur family ferric uptake transcriptional regulator
MESRHPSRSTFCNSIAILRHNQHITRIERLIMKKSAISTKAAGKTAAVNFQSIAETQLRDNALRVTDARIKVLAALLGAPYAFSHQDAQDALPDMDRVTLYRTLDSLTDAGLAHKIPGDDRVFRYNAAVEHHDHGDKGQVQQHQHGHFKCTRCARVFCIDSVDESLLNNGKSNAASSEASLRQQLQTALQVTLGKGFQSHDIELTIKGWCADCAH